MTTVRRMADIASEINRVAATVLNPAGGSCRRGVYVHPQGDLPFGCVYSDAMTSRPYQMGATRQRGFSFAVRVYTLNDGDGVEGQIVGPEQLLWNLIAAFELATRDNSSVLGRGIPDLEITGAILENQDGNVNQQYFTVALNVSGSYDSHVGVV